MACSMGGALLRRRLSKAGWSRTRVVGCLLAAAAAAGACALPGATPAATTIPSLPRPFARTSFWNAPLPAGAPLAPSSPALVHDLVRQTRRWVPWINTNKYSAPVYVVGSDQQRVPVHLDHGGWWAGTHADGLALAQAFAAGVPIPNGARPAGGKDRSMVVWQPSTDTMWELLEARHAPDDFDPWSPLPGWHAEWGARIDRVSLGSGVVPFPFGASSSGLALAGGMISASELQQGRIGHALSLGIPQVKKGAPAPPANRSDGKYRGLNAIREGQRFRLDPSLDIASLRLPRIARMIAVAAQRYGIVVIDVSGAISFYAQDPRSIGFNPYPALFGRQRPDQILRRFPWNRLEAVASGPGGVPPVRVTSRAAP
jgi:hypothetical protein